MRLGIVKNPSYKSGIYLYLHLPESFSANEEGVLVFVALSRQEYNLEIVVDRSEELQRAPLLQPAPPCGRNTPGGQLSTHVAVRFSSPVFTASSNDKSQRYVYVKKRVFIVYGRIMVFLVGLLGFVWIKQWGQSCLRRARSCASIQLPC